ncbi:MAG: hypothetical protein GWN00_04180, partial [Aliifodinibius sp.]|nr:hypothetical protein [Fodinibius sp.]NIV10377.1 hypothetical protein [Fodinibius sp.]NIY24029.1 hypothetical protein [Fodinibius sp.]
MIVYESPRDYHQPRSKGNSIDDLMDANDIYPEKIDLQTYVFRQIVDEIEEEDYIIVSHILTSLNEDGFLDVHPIEICNYLHITLSKFNSLIDIIKKAEPIGVGTRNPREAMLVQVEMLRESNDIPVGVKQVLECCFEELSHHRYDIVAKSVGITREEAIEVAKFIAKNLNPNPGRAFYGDVHAPVENPIETYHAPDVIINKMNTSSDTLTVELITPYLGSLRVNSIFKKASSQIKDDEKKEQWKDNLDKASL